MAHPTPDIEKILKVKQYRKRKFTYREIAALMNSDVKTVYRWDGYSVGKNGVKKLSPV